MVEHGPIGAERSSGNVIETTLKDILENSFGQEHDKYNLLSQPLTLASVPYPLLDETIYLGLIHHPVSGTHLGQILSEIAPYPQSYSGIKDDFRQMRISYGHASKGETGSDLYDMHGDPRIEIPFRRFYGQHFKKWEQALDNNEFSPLYESLYGIVFTYSAKALGNELAMQWRKISESDGYSNGKMAIRDAIQLVGSESFLTFLIENPLFLKGLREPIQELDKARIIDRFGRINYTKSMELAMDFVKSLGQDELRDIVLQRIIANSDHTLVDMEKQEVTSRHNKVNLQFDDSNRLLIDDMSGSRLVVQPRLETTGNYSWRVVDHDTTEPKGKFLQPLIAWANNGERRRYLSQPEAQQALQQIGLSSHKDTADIALGKVVGNIPMKYYIDSWDRRIALKKPDGTMSRKQEIRAAQAPVWVDLPENANIINVPYHYFRYLEEAVR